MIFLIVLGIFMVLCKVYSVLTLGRCHSKRKLHGKTALVTGSNRGVGYMTALNLAKRGARVIITSEDKEDLKRAQDEMKRESGNNNIVAKHLDFSSLDGVRAFAEDLIATEQRLDILVNNAGVLAAEDNLTKDGLSTVMQINYFGPFLLTNLLLDLLKKSAPSRIVNVASVNANCTLSFDPSDITRVRTFCTWSRTVNEMLLYSNSKICMVLFTVELAERLRGSGVTVNCLHPGVVNTQIYKNMFKKNHQRLVEILCSCYMKTTEEGAETSVHLAVCESVAEVSGRYFSDCRESTLWADLKPTTRNQVWEQSLRLVMHCNNKTIQNSDNKFSSNNNLINC